MFAHALWQSEQIYVFIRQRIKEKSTCWKASGAAPFECEAIPLSAYADEVKGVARIHSFSTRPVCENLRSAIIYN